MALDPVRRGRAQREPVLWDSARRRETVDGGGDRTYGRSGHRGDAETDGRGALNRTRGCPDKN